MSANNLHDEFDKVGSKDPDQIARTVLADIQAGKIHLDKLYTAVYMEATAWLNAQINVARSAHFTARKERKAAEKSGNSQRVAKAVHDELAARKAFLNENLHLGDGKYKLVGDCTVGDFDLAIAWVTRHELDPAKKKVELYKSYQDDLKKAGVTTLRSLP